MINVQAVSRAAVPCLLQVVLLLLALARDVPYLLSLMRAYKLVSEVDMLCEGSRMILSGGILLILEI